MKNLRLFFMMMIPLIVGCNGVSALVNTEKSNCEQAITEHIKGQAGGAMALSAMFGQGQKIDIESINVELAEYKKHIEITANDSMEYYKQLAATSRQKTIERAKEIYEDFQSEVEKQFNGYLEKRAACQKIIDENPADSYIATIHRQTMESYPATMEEYIALDTLKAYSRYREAEQLHKKYLEAQQVDIEEYYTRYPGIEYYKALPSDKVLLRVAMVKYMLKIPGEEEEECVKFYYFNDDMSHIWGEFNLSEEKELPNNKRLG